MLKSFVDTWNLALGLATVSKEKHFYKKKCLLQLALAKSLSWPVNDCKLNDFFSFHFVLSSPYVISLDSIFISWLGDDELADEYLFDDNAALDIENTRETEYFLTSP